VIFRDFGRPGPGRVLGWSFGGLSTASDRDADDDSV